MKIALAHDWLTNYAGAEQLLFYLHKIYPAAPIYTTLYNQAVQQKFDQQLIVTSWLQKIPGATNHHQLAVPLMPLAINWNFDQYDLVISDCSWVMKGLRARKHLAIILTPTRWLWGFGGDRRLETQNFASLLVPMLKRWDLAAAQKPDVLVAISKTVQERIKQVYRRDSVVVYPPVEIDRFKSDKKIKTKDYFLSVGRLVPYKRVDLIIQAFNRLGWPLKIIGNGPEEKRLKDLAFPNIEFLGHVDDQTRDQYLREARGFVFAGEEDFGIVMVEALAAGRPVIAYGAGGATEIVQEGESGLFFQEQTADSLVKTLEKFAKSHFDEEKIIRSVRHFNPERFQKEIKTLADNLVK